MNLFDTVERTATLCTLVLLFGAAVFRVRVATLLRARANAAGDPAAFAERLESLAKRTAVAAGAVLVVLAFVRLHAHVVALFDGWSGIDVSGMQGLLVTTNWGRAWLLQLAASLVIAAGPLLGKALDGWMAIPLAISAALNGHAASGDMVLLTVGADALHVLAAGGWIGGLYFVLVATAVSGGPADVLRVVRAFNAVALACAGIVVSTGVFAAFVHVGSFGALRTTDYGTQLIVKVLFVLVVVAAGAWNWRRATPALVAGDVRAIRRGVAFELAFSLAVLLVTARLVLLEPPSGGP